MIEPQRPRGAEGTDANPAKPLQSEESLREHFDSLPIDNKYMNKLHGLLSRWSDRKFTASYRYNTRDLVVGLAVEAEKQVRERTEATLKEAVAQERQRILDALPVSRREGHHMNCVTSYSPPSPYVSHCSCGANENQAFNTALQEVKNIITGEKA